MVNAFSILCVVQPVSLVSIHFYCFPLLLAPVSLMSVKYSLLRLISDHSLCSYSDLIMSWKLRIWDTFLRCHFCYLMKRIIAATMERVTAEAAEELMMMAVNIILSFSLLLSFSFAGCPENGRFKHLRTVGRQQDAARAHWDYLGATKLVGVAYKTCKESRKGSGDITGW